MYEDSPPSETKALLSNQKEDDSSKKGCSSPTSSTIFGLIIVLLIVVVSLSSNILAHNLLHGRSFPQFFLIYWNVSFDLSAFAIAAVTGAMASRGSKTLPSDGNVQTDMLSTPQPVRQVSTARMAKVALLLTIVYQAGNYLYFAGLANTGVSVTQIVYQTSTIWVFCLSLVFLKTEVQPFKISAVLLCAAGVLFVALDKWDGGATMQGVSLLLVSSLLWAFYEVLFKALLPATTVTDVNIFIGMRGLFNAALLWPILLALHFSGAESLSSLTLHDMKVLSALALLSVAVSVLVVLGISLTSPLFVRVGATLLSPASILWDLYLGYHPGWKCYLGSLLTFLAFAVLNLPWPSERLKTTTSPLKCLGTSSEQKSR
eukprot:m.124114 g.124114  ORF g.124114 m.124114 type:complete len:373 (+) comp14467_c0_seq1:236-1354(+)